MTYKAGQIVSQNGSAYIAKTDPTGTPGSDPAWSLLARGVPRPVFSGEVLIVSPGPTPQWVSGPAPGALPDPGGEGQVLTVVGGSWQPSMPALPSPSLLEAYRGDWQPQGVKTETTFGNGIPAGWTITPAPPAHTVTTYGFDDGTIPSAFTLPAAGVSVVPASDCPQSGTPGSVNVLKIDAPAGGGAVSVTFTFTCVGTAKVTIPYATVVPSTSDLFTYSVDGSGQGWDPNSRYWGPMWLSAFPPGTHTITLSPTANADEVKAWFGNIVVDDDNIPAAPTQPIAKQVNAYDLYYGGESFIAGQTPAPDYDTYVLGLLGEGVNSSTLTASFPVTLVNDGSVRIVFAIASEQNWDFGTILIDGVQQYRTSGQQGWYSMSFPLTAGSHTIGLAYSKDSSASASADAFYVARVELIDGSAAVYAAGNLVRHGGHLFLALTDPGNDEPVDGTTWAQLV